VCVGQRGGEQQAFVARPEAKCVWACGFWEPYTAEIGRFTVDGKCLTINP